MAIRPVHFRRMASQEGDVGQQEQLRQVRSADTLSRGRIGNATEASDEDEEERQGLPQLSARALWKCITQGVRLAAIAAKGSPTADEATLSGECFTEMAVADKVLAPIRRYYGGEPIGIEQRPQVLWWDFKGGNEHENNASSDG